MMTSALPGATRDELDMLERRVLLGRSPPDPAQRDRPDSSLRRLGEHVFDSRRPCPIMRASMATRSSGASSPTSRRPSTNRRRPFSVGTRPALVCGRIEQAHRFQVRHHVADRGRRQRQRQALGQGARAHRLAGGQKGLHQMAEDFARPLAQGCGSGSLCTVSESKD